MLPAIIDNDADRHFAMLDSRTARFCMLFLSREALKENSCRPHWVRECGDERSLTGMGRWFAMRRDQWQAWGELAERIGNHAFYEHMKQLMDAEPVEAVEATTVSPLDDPAEIALGQLLNGPAGQRLEVVHVHRFASPKLRDRFFDWFYTDLNYQLASALLGVGWNQGGVALSRSLDEIAAHEAEPVRKAPHGRRRGRSSRRVNA